MLQAQPDEELLVALQAQAEAEADGLRKQNIAYLLRALATIGSAAGNAGSRNLARIQPQAAVDLVDGAGLHPAPPRAQRGASPARGGDGERR